MVRMSDILKRAKEKERKAKEEKQRKPLIEPAQQEVSPEPVKPVKEGVTPEAKADEVEKPKIEQQPEVREQKEEKVEISGVRISPVVMKGTRVASSEETEKLYEETLSLVREILKEKMDYESIDIKRFTAPVEKLVNQLRLGNKRLLMLAYIKDSQDENYLFCHSVNVCICSIEIGLGLGYEKSRLTELGICALLHDTGMSAYRHLSNQPRKLTVKEYNEIKEHPIKGTEILEKIKNLNKIALYVAHQEHERVDGSGYPRGLKKNSIHEYAKIVALVDTYEALLHRRAYREEFLASEAIQQILAEKDGFENKLIKLLIERIGIFPTGSLVELNTREMAQVVGLNHAVPLRPVVKILLEPNREEPKETKVLDLTSHPTIYIRKAIRKSEPGTLQAI